MEGLKYGFIGLEMSDSDKRLDRRWCLADAMYCNEQASGNPTDCCRRLFPNEMGGSDNYTSGESEEA